MTFPQYMVIKFFKPIRLCKYLAISALLVLAVVQQHSLLMIETLARLISCGTLNLA